MEEKKNSSIDENPDYHITEKEIFSFSHVKDHHHYNFIINGDNFDYRMFKNNNNATV